MASFDCKEGIDHLPKSFLFGFFSVHKKFKHEKGNGGGKSTRENLLWDLIFTGKNTPHKENSRSRHLHGTLQKQQQSNTKPRQRSYYEKNNNLEVHTVPLKLGKHHLYNFVCSHLFNSLRGGMGQQIVRS